MSSKRVFEVPKGMNLSVSISRAAVPIQSRNSATRPSRVISGTSDVLSTRVLRSLVLAAD